MQAKSLHFLITHDKISQVYANNFTKEKFSTSKFDTKNIWKFFFFEFIFCLGLALRLIL
jgi:hypothetical protein